MNQNQSEILVSRITKCGGCFTFKAKYCYWQVVLKFGSEVGTAQKHAVAYKDQIFYQYIQTSEDFIS